VIINELTLYGFFVKNIGGLFVPSQNFLRTKRKEI